MIHYPSTFYMPSYKQHMDIYGVQQIIWVGGFTVATPLPESDSCCFANWKSPRNEEERYTSSKFWGSLKSHQRKWMLGFEDLLRSKKNRVWGWNIIFSTRTLRWWHFPSGSLDSESQLGSSKNFFFSWFCWIKIHVGFLMDMPNPSKPTHLPVEWPCVIWFCWWIFRQSKGPFTYQY